VRRFNYGKKIGNTHSMLMLTRIHSVFTQTTLDKGLIDGIFVPNTGAGYAADTAPK
jgi:hypothetical protein